MSFLCYLWHLGPNRGVQVSAILENCHYFSIHEPVCILHTGGNGKMRLRCTVLRGVHGRVGGRLCGGHARVCFLRKAVAGGLASFAQRSRVGLRQPGQLCPGNCVRGNCVRGRLRPVAHLRAGYLRTGYLRLAHLCPMDTRARGTCVRGISLSDPTCRRGHLRRVAAGHTGLSPCRPHPGLRHPGAPASGVRYKQCRRRPAKHAKRRRHKA